MLSPGAASDGEKGSAGGCRISPLPSSISSVEEKENPGPALSRGSGNKVDQENPKKERSHTEETEGTEELGRAMSSSVTSVPSV
jgi:hypothetical protein